MSSPKADETRKTVLLEKSPSETKEFQDLYPERRGGHKDVSYFDLMFGRGKVSDMKKLCEKNVIRNIEDMPMVRTLIGALEASGCPFDISRHVLCDMCESGKDIQHAGGYDEVNNQVFVCANNCDNLGPVHGTLVRNLISMFDRCVRNVDAKNVDHLACTEVRKANLGNCTFLLYMQRTDANFAVKRQHSRCVRNTAIEGLVKTKFVPEDVAKEAVDRVFDKCYDDLEPIGRKLFDKVDIYLASKERFLFGYK